MPEPHVCVVGSLNMDLVVRVPKLPAPSETVLGGAYRTYPGGKGANQAVAAARMGAKVSLIGCIGSDAHGSKLRETLDPEGLNLTYLHTRQDSATGLGLVMVADGGQNMIVVSPGANASLTAEDIQAARQAILESQVLLTQLETPNPALAECIQIADDAGKVIILNAAPARILSRDLLKRVDVLVVNRSEAAKLLSVEPTMDPARMMLRLPDLGPPTVVVTLGAQGAILCSKGRPRRVNSPHVEAIDAVGAGDAFCGTLAALWPEVVAANHHDELPKIEEIVAIACAAGAVACTRSGAIASLPRRDEVMKLLGKA